MSTLSAVLPGAKSKESDLFNRIEIIRNIDDLNQIVYVFWIDEANVYLDEMRVQSRQSRRHKFKTDLSSSYSRISDRNFGIKDEPEIDIDVQVDAVNLTRKKITFSRWKDK